MAFLRRYALFLGGTALFAFGVFAGGYLFSDTQPRSFFALHACGERCFKRSEILGLLGSVIVQKYPDLIPEVLYETDRTIAINYPVPHEGDHYVIIPKRDIRHIGDVRAGDEAALMDAFGVVGELVRQRGWTSYRVLTYGPERQDFAYLHFHLLGPGAN